MLDSTSVTGTTTATIAAAAVSTTDAATSLSSDFETFLEMLTAQVRYQDPLEPIESSEYAAQLAQFSMVEQQVLSNDLLTSLTAQLGSSNMSQMASWIGMEALSIAPVQFDGTPVTINPNPLTASDEVVLVVYNANGNEVQRQQLPVAAEPVDWAGVQSDGTPFPSGTYSFEIESRAGGELLVSDQAETYSRITEARTQDGQTVLILQSGAAVLSSAVSGIRESGPDSV